MNAIERAALSLIVDPGASSSNDGSGVALTLLSVREESTMENTTKSQRKYFDICHGPSGSYVASRIEADSEQEALASYAITAQLRPDEVPWYDAEPHSCDRECEYCPVCRPGDQELLEDEEDELDDFIAQASEEEVSS